MAKRVRMRQLVTVLLSLLGMTTMVGLRVAYTVEIQNWFLWIGTVIASWACVFALGYVIAVIQYTAINSRSPYDR